MKMFKTKEFAEAIGCSYRTVQDWRITHKGRPPCLLPARYENKGRVAIYSEEQIPLALALLGKKDSDDSGNLFVGLVDTPDTDVPVVEETANETDGSEEDDFADALPALVLNADDSDDDSELIDPPADGEDLQDARAVFSVALTNDTVAVYAPVVDKPVETARRGINLIAMGWNDVEAKMPDGSEIEDELPATSQPLVADDVPAADTITDVPDAPTDAAPADVPVVDKQARIDAAKKFFDLLFGKLTAPHFSYLAKYKGGTQFPEFAVANETQRADMARKAIELSDMGVDIWHAVNPVSVKPHYEFDEKKGKDVLKRGDEDVVSYQTALVTDIDVFGAAHKSGNLAADFNEAKSFLPFPPSILINSGHGLQAYYLFDEPLSVTDDNREEIKRRNNRLLDVIRAKAAGKQIDGVGDLPRILRTPGTFNYKLGKDNAPLCHVVEVNDVRFTPADIDERLDALTPATLLTAPIEPARAADTKNPAAKLTDLPNNDDPDLKAFRIRHMLPCINVVKGEYNKWVQVGMGLYNEGLTCADWEQWSRTQPEFKEGECSEKWLTFGSRNDGIKIGTLYQWAVEGGYDDKPVQREWYQLHPDKSRKNDYAAQIEKLKADLRDVAQKLDDFDKLKEAALKRLGEFETFDSDTCFADDFVEAGAFARLCDRQAYSDLKLAIKKYGNKHKDQKVSVNDWIAVVRDKAEQLEKNRSDLAADAIALQAEIQSAEFVAADDELRGVKIPKGYSVSDGGVWQAKGEGMIQVCRLPVLIRGKVYDYDAQKYKLILTYKKKSGGWKRLQAQYSSTVFDARKLVALADDWLPVTSSNATSMVDYLNAYIDVNEIALPITYTVGRGGWYEFGGKEIFIDPRRVNVVTDNGKKVSVVVDSNSQFANALRSKGTLEEWKRAYEMAKPSPVARLMVAASVAVPLLKVLGERNFWVHVNAPTRAGKTTALLLGATAVGSEKIVRSFDATKNGLAGAAADVNDFVFAIDEKQVADPRTVERFGELIYSLSNGIGRTKLKRDSSLMGVKEWRTIIVTTGETEMTPDNATGGADTRLLPINAPKSKKILPADTCKAIRHIGAENYGHAFMLVVDKIIEHREDLRGWYDDVADAYREAYPEMLDEYCRYVACLTLADGLLNSALGVEKALPDATRWAKEIFKLIPTAAEIDDTARERDFVIGFIAQNVSCFIDAKSKLDFLPKPLYGLLNDKDDYSYVTVEALKRACSDGGFNYRKVVADLTAVDFFVAADTVEKSRKTRLATVKKQISKVNVRCYRIKNSDLKAAE